MLHFDMIKDKETIIEKGKVFTISKPDDFVRAWEEIAMKLTPILEQKFNIKIRYTGRVIMDKDNLGLPEFALVYTAKDIDSEASKSGIDPEIYNENKKNQSE